LLVLGAAVSQLARQVSGLKLKAALEPKRQVSHRAPTRVLVSWQ
jgi:hypothetical protein